MEYERETCKHLQFNLLRLLGSPLLASSYLRELEETTHCDQHYYQKGLREETRKDLGAEQMERIVTFTNNDSDELKAIRLVDRKRNQYREQLWERLPWIDRLQYTLQDLAPRRSV